MRTILITGSSDGLGRYLALRLAERGDRVIVHGRSAERAAQVREEIQRATGAADRADVLLADFAELRQVDRLADEVLARHDRLDVLVNNAGIGGAPHAGRELSRDGVELRFAVNYLAGYRLTERLLPLLRASAPARVVNVASVGQQAIDFDDPMLERGHTVMGAYAQSKLAQIMYTFDLAERLDGALVNALHPATFMDTTMVREGGIAPWNTVETGARAVLRLIDDADPGTGGYFDGERPARADEQAYDRQARRRLTELSDTLIARALG
ncbi:SDR family NAD(P)-dependent oxidoreductase [Streptomyces litchfieldiae]|uniref:SDR family NAD(P)-dependent oxidoreductase n=1 Tax=Streptomyces litchfieldiae TaxID=3075543 RepID=A0ABU2MNX9_9ACTN|nr:SDR family NAD(P)-dependent oxidoreductase [Streptomyces sp. DSM 44938]MDT0343322.1 SDR family NAD(P)-dependent oxidoreductase [Streptomyces sp. DSM 44938]